MTTFSYSYARQNLKHVFDRATEKLEEISITRRNGKNIIIMDEEEFLGFKETVYLLSNPHNAAHLQKSLDEKERRDTVKISLEDL